MDTIHVYCPKCQWEPDGHRYWVCTCAFKWDTFSTGGRCPNCGKVWDDTQCIGCEEWSPHLDWYHGLDEIVTKLKDDVL